MATFRKCLRRAEASSDTVCLGGGEPTLHPQFERMLLEAMAMETWGEECVTGLVTNGSIEHRALMVARLARLGMITARLSLDRFHDRSMVSDKVVEAFTIKKQPGESIWTYREREPKDNRGINDGSGVLINVCRCDFGEDRSCVCPGREVMPNGDVYACACRPGRMIGNINSLDFNDPWYDCDCYKDIEKEEAEAAEAAAEAEREAIEPSLPGLRRVA